MQAREPVIHSVVTNLYGPLVTSCVVMTLWRTLYG